MIQMWIGCTIELRLKRKELWRVMGFLTGHWTIRYHLNKMVVSVPGPLLWKWWGDGATCRLQEWYIVATPVPGLWMLFGVKIWEASNTALTRGTGSVFRYSKELGSDRIYRTQRVHNQPNSWASTKRFLKSGPRFNLK